MQGNQPIRQHHHIQFAFALSPHLVGLQQVFNHGRGEHVLQHSQIDLLTDLALLGGLAYRSHHEAVSFFRVLMASSMPSQPPLCLVSYAFALFEPYWGTAPDPSQGADAPCIPALLPFT